MIEALLRQRLFFTHVPHPPPIYIWNVNNGMGDLLIIASPYAHTSRAWAQYG